MARTARRAVITADSGAEARRRLEKPGFTFDLQPIDRHEPSGSPLKKSVMVELLRFVC